MIVPSRRQERLKTEKLLGSLLPPAILKQMKNGEVPEPEVETNHKGNICWYNDNHCLKVFNNYDVYKVLPSSKI